jgi:outer membrane biosynthesis protein TonB
MRAFIESIRERHILEKSIKTRNFLPIALICSATFFAAQGQAPASSQPSPQTESSAPAAPVSAPQSQAPGDTSKLSEFAIAAKNAPHSADGVISEDQIKQILSGKNLFLRGAYLDNALEFDQHGNLSGHSPRGSYTLCDIRINKVKFSRHKVEFEGDRYALHFLGELPHEDPLKDVNRVKITPKKKVVKISIDREVVEKPKKKKHGNKDEEKSPGSSLGAPSPAAESSTPGELSEGKRFSATTSPAHASQTLINALDRVFAMSVDDRMIDQMPDFWKLYYEAAAANTDYSPTDPGVSRQNSVDQKARLLTTIDPPSNELAQENGVAGMALYHAIVGSDGKVEEVVAGRPIGFGLDESAVDAIHKAAFQPAMKDGKPVPVALDLVVSFRIYSNRTSQTAAQQAAEGPAQQVLPGPFSVQRQ